MDFFLIDPIDTSKYDDHSSSLCSCHIWLKNQWAKPFRAHDARIISLAFHFSYTNSNYATFVEHNIETSGDVAEAKHITFLLWQSNKFFICIGFVVIVWVSHVGFLIASQ